MTDKIYLDCTFDEKDEVKALGARWDKFAKAWYILPHMDRSKFKRWLHEDEQPAAEKREPTVVFDPDKEMLRRLIQLCHPDKHNDSISANSATKYLLSLKAKAELHS